MAPEYQKFTKTINDYIPDATKSVAGRYDTRIQGEQANLPLIQQQYQNLANSIKTDQAQQTEKLNKDAASNIGAARLRNATQGIFSSSENRAEERNTKANVDSSVTNMAAKIADTLAQLNTERSSKELGLQNVIRGLESDKESAIGQAAWQMFDTDYQRHDTEQNRAIEAWWRDQQARQQQEQMAFERDMALKNYGLSAGRAGIEDRSAMNAKTSEIADYVSQMDQNAAYNYIKGMAPSWQQEGIDVNKVWNVWQQSKYGGKVPANIIAQGQAAVDAYLKSKSSSSSSSTAKKSTAKSPYGSAMDKLYTKGTIRPGNY